MFSSLPICSDCSASNDRPATGRGRRAAGTNSATDSVALLRLHSLNLNSIISSIQVPVKEDREITSEQIAYGCKVMTEKYNIDPILARNFYVQDMDWIRSNNRKNLAKEFRKEYDYGRGKDIKTCIWPEDTLSWHDESCGTMWVGVHGTDWICVVTRSGDLDVTRLCGSLINLPTHEVFFNFRKSLIVEIEDLANSYSKLRQRFQQKIEKPLGVVSVIQDNNNKDNHPTEYGEMKAMEFLKEKLNGDTVFTVNETIQTAICAFQHLFQKKFNADEIMVSVLDPEYIKKKVEVGWDLTVEELNMCQMREHLDVINKKLEEDASIMWWPSSRL